MIFSEDDNSFSLAANSLQSDNLLRDGFWLVLVGINETPPHIALISEGKYYSVSTRKVDCGTSLERLLSILERKQVPTLFIQINLTDTGGQNFELLQNIFKNVSPLDTTEETCLSPIKKFFVENISAEFAMANYVYELFALSEEKDLLKNSVSLYCNLQSTNSITLPKYTMAQIKDKIVQLSHQTVR